MLKFDVTFERVTQKKLSPDKLKEQLQFIGGSARRSASNNWKVSIPSRLVREVEHGEGENRTIQYTAVIQLQKERYIDADAVRRRFTKTKIVMERAARQKGWKVLADEAVIPANRNGEYQVVNGAGEPVGDPAPRLSAVLQVVPPPVSPYFTGDSELPLLDDLVMRCYFNRIYDRESHIRIVYDNLKTAVRTRFKTRHHILLKGPPACAKTELFLAFIDWLGSDLIEALDASTMTKAGLERMLMDKAQSGTLKPIFLIEEIEKCHPDNVSCLIQVMDARGKIQRVNANTVRDGETVADCPIILWGTCNDEEELRKAHRGALWSRFSSKLDCERPDRTLMKKILLREVSEINGKEEWVEPVLDFCYNELQKIDRFQSDFNDPRFARALLVGGDRLLDLSDKGFFSDYRKVTKIR